MIQPCRAQCAWCATHRKNALFARLRRAGQDARFHRFYAEAVRRLRPEQVFVSGGEPLLHPGLGVWVHAVEPYTAQVNLFTSFQYRLDEQLRAALARLPPDRVVLCHTVSSFERSRWERFTGGFPFERYVENLRYAGRLPLRKHLKFIVNRRRVDDDLHRFCELVRPDDSFRVSLKLLNDQAGSTCHGEMLRTRAVVRDRLARLPQLDRIRTRFDDELGPRQRGSLDLMAAAIRSGDVEACPYRREPLEVRFALDRKARQGRAVLRYRYCPYFPRDTGHRFHVGRDELSKLAKNYHRGGFREHCSRCRAMTYAATAELAHQASLVR